MFAPAAGILRHVDLRARLDKREYERERRLLQAKPHLLGFQLYQQKRPMAIVFEGWDAAGKGGAIKRLTEKIDPRS
jgi:polyphosphate kinase 2 (PPK2 family)